MMKRELGKCASYVAPKHFGCHSLRLQGQQESGAEKFWMGMSFFLPGGGCEFDASPTEKMYFVLDGEITVTGAGDERHVLQKYDSLRIAPNESRSIKNETNLPATILVVISILNS